MTNRAYLLACSTALTAICSLAIAQPCVAIQSVLMVADDGDISDAYGWAVAIEGNTAIVGSLYDDAIGSDSGSAYILSYDGASWDQTQKLVATGIGGGDGFGDSVAIHKDTLVIGAPGDDDAGSGAGAAYVYTRAAGVWAQTAKLVPPMLVSGDNFASAVDIDNDTIVLSAALTDTTGSNSGKAYIYRLTKGTWQLEAQLVSNDIAEFDRFAGDVAISGSHALIGAASDDDNGSGSGSAYVFTRTGTAWNQTAKLTASDGTSDDNFGDRLDISDDSIIIGARNEDDLGTNSGAVYIFEFENNDWTQKIKLTAFDGTSFEYFGQDVAIHNNRAIVGAWGQNDRFGFFNAGAAYAYSRTAGLWSLDNKIVASDREGGDFFGYSVAVTDNHAIIGADGNDDFWWGPDAGSAYMISVDCQNQCPADLTLDGNLNFLDISLFLTAFGAADPAADFEHDGDFNFLDVSAFLAAFGAGCP